MFFNATNPSLRRFFEWAFYIFIAVFPFLFSKGYLYYGTSSRSVLLVVVIELMAIVFGFAILNKKENISIAKSPITLVLALFLGTLLLSSLSGVDFHSSFWSKATRTTGIFYLLHLGLFYLFFFSLFNEENKLRKLLKVFLISACVFSIGSFLSRDGIGLIFTSKPWTGFTFGNSTFAGMYIYGALMLSIYYVATEQKIKGWWKSLLPILLIINPYFINREVWLGNVNLFKDPLGIIGEAQATSYAVFFSLIALFVIYLVSKIKNWSVKKNILLGSVALGLALGFIAVISFLSPHGYLHEKYLNLASSARPLVWGISERAISDKPALGWGTDNFDRAFEAHYDNRLLEEKNGAEPWFDRAHNIFFDQTTETGYVGFGVYLLIYLTIIGSMIYVLFRSKEKNDHLLSFVVIVFLVGHFMELQTAFDTSISYIPLTIITAISAILFHKVYTANKGEKSLWILPSLAHYILGAVLIVSSGIFLFVGTIPIMRAQSANGSIRVVGSSEKRLPIYTVLFGSPLDKATFLWRTSSDLQRGVADNPTILEDQNSVLGFKNELSLIVDEYKKYLSNHELDYRSHLNLADVYIYERLFEVDHLDKAHVELDKSIELVPSGPQAYWMKAVAYLYQRKFDLAREWAKKGYEINPNIEQSQKIIDYIDRSIKTFPEIDLYHFLLI